MSLAFILQNYTSACVCVCVCVTSKLFSPYSWSHNKPCSIQVWMAKLHVCVARVSGGSHIQNTFVYPISWMPSTHILTDKHTHRQQAHILNLWTLAQTRHLSIISKNTLRQLTIIIVFITSSHKQKQKNVFNVLWRHKLQIKKYFYDGLNVIFNIRYGNIKNK